MGEPEDLIVYVDGFNLYHGLHQEAGRRLLWLDLLGLAARLRPTSNVMRVNYFTAPVLGDAAAASRQAEYQNALKALHGDRIRIVQGRYQAKEMRCRACGATWIKHEEKETDVNIAVEIVADASARAMQSALIVSADSDLAPAVRTAHRINPGLVVVAGFPPKRFSAELQRLMPSSFHINRARLRSSLMPDTVTGTNGAVFTRPQKWR